MFENRYDVKPTSNQRYLRRLSHPEACYHPLDDSCGQKATSNGTVHRQAIAINVYVRSSAGTKCMAFVQYNHRRIEDHSEVARLGVPRLWYLSGIRLSRKVSP